MKSIYGVELMTTGDPDGRGIVFTEDDLQSIADSFTALGLTGRVPLKLGHNDTQPLTDGQPALGWIGRVWRDGSKLLADFVDMSDTAFNVIKKKMYKFVSVELLKNVQAGTRSIPWVLDAVALLGADQPAFGTLKEIEALKTRRKPAFRAASRTAFKRVCFNTGKEVNDMDEKDVQAAIDKAVNGVTEKFTKTMEDREKKHREELEAKDAELKKERIKAHREGIVALFNRAIEEKRIEPAVREKFEKLTGLTDDARAEAVKREDAESFIKDNTKAAKKGERSKAGGEGGEEGGDENGMTNQEVVLARATKIVLTRGQKPSDVNAISSAIQDTLRADKKLAQAYFDSPNEQAEAV